MRDILILELPFVQNRDSILCQFESTQFSMKFILLINAKMPTIVGILAFISKINTTSECFNQGTPFIFQHFSFYEQLHFYAQLS